ncbi:MAG: 3-carboxy-cis,cis-muconate cycloisomerase [Sulfitobacter sp.]|jgi:3-carboxy-cis,cis-muconate cycloisomerase
MSPVFDHPWLGGFFGDQQGADIWSPARQLTHMLHCEAAFTRALGAMGDLPVDQADDLARRITDFVPDMDDLRSGTARDGLPVPALVAQLKTAAEAQEKFVHSGMTSQDVMDTALSLSLQEFNCLLAQRLGGLQENLAGLSRTFGASLMMGRTRMQAALPITVQDRLRTWSGPLTTHQTRLAQLRPRVELLQLGGAVGTNAALADKAAPIAADMAAQLGLHQPKQTWHALRDGVAEYANLLALISGSLGKIGQDICLMAQQGVDEIALSGGGGSSAMPHKQNPVLAELLITLARYNATQLAGIHAAMLHEQERSGAAWMLEWMILPDMARTTARSLSVLAELCTRITHMGRKSRAK